MKWINKLEKKYSKYSIKNLMLYIILLTATVFFLSMYDRTFLNKLILIPEKVLKGEVWRLITFIFIPPTSSPIFIIFVLFLYYTIGHTLELKWGSFKFNLYYLLGVLFTIISAFIFGGIGTSFYINLTLFLAFARLHPDYQIYIFFVLPVKMRYLAIFTWLYLGYQFLISPIQNKVTLIFSLANYIIFFGNHIVQNIKRKIKVHKRRNEFYSDYKNENEQDTIHKCTICGITEKVDPSMEFRYCSKCDGYHEYCMKHLNDHQHIKEKKNP
ncbi:MAG: hypothetical protein ACOCRK_00550 [bacterium]